VRRPPMDFPVFVRYKVTTMRGTNPDGSKYVDPGIPWVSYFNGATPCTASSVAVTGPPERRLRRDAPANAAVVWR